MLTKFPKAPLYITRFLASVIAFGALLPAAVSQGGILVTGIELQAAPNAIGIRWQAPAGASIDHYKVYFAKASILENNGRFLGTEETIGNQTSIALLDLTNRGFTNTDKIYVTVTAIAMDGTEHRAFGEEKSTSVILTQGATHAAADIAVSNAIAEDETTIRIVFTAPIAIPEGHPAMHISIVGEDGSSVSALSMAAMGNDLILRTTPMTVRTRYTVTIQSTVKGADGSAIDATKNTATVAARPSGEEVEIPTETIPIPELTTSSSSTSSVSSSSTSSSSSVSSPAPEPLPDTIPPEDASNLTLKRTLQTDGNYTVEATWKASRNTANDLASYKLYESIDRGRNFVGPTVVLGTVLSTKISNLAPGTFTLKITAADHTGNESQGIMETIILPQTGAATLLLSSLGAAVVSARRIRRGARGRR
ncbi:MAG TPA: hypothetical protein VJB60_02020 [Candidatus Peribacterales bacterium]|nr:hypothetical protein [Candidatus Peribacterales bacterium]